MTMPIKIALLREGKNPPDKRVPFTPRQVEEIMQRFPQVTIICQVSDVRCFKEEEYRALGIEVKEDILCLQLLHPLTMLSDYLKELFQTRNRIVILRGCE